MRQSGPAALQEAADGVVALRFEYKSRLSRRGTSDRNENTRAKTIAASLEPPVSEIASLGSKP